MSRFGSNIIPLFFQLYSIYSFERKSETDAGEKDIMAPAARSYLLNHHYPSESEWLEFGEKRIIVVVAVGTVEKVEGEREREEKKKFYPKLDRETPARDRI